MKRIILSIPAGSTFDQLTEAQRAAIAAVLGQYVRPIPDTTEANGRALVDALTTDTFDPAMITALGLDWTVLGLWQWAGPGSEHHTLIPPDTATLATHQLHPGAPYPHNWSGWPTVLV